MDLHASGFWYSLGYTRIGGGIVILLVSVEVDSRVLNVDGLVRTKSSLL